MAGAPSPPPPFYGAKHRAFVLSLEAQRGERLEFVVSEKGRHLRLSALYWGLSTLEPLSSGHLLDKAAIVRKVQQCRAPDGGYSGAPGHDSHLVHTLSALQLLALCGGGGDGGGEGGGVRPLGDDTAAAAATAAYLARLQLPNGAISGDARGEA